ncbi:uncharacterized protein LOC142972501 [Anticarsia gemmatalis]|uniref:uncharacterized protein LOC142972501 n=1 Tax=Anticarsia gemmatalis TaxID=129554 RepID=UPI003F75A5EF
MANKILLLCLIVASLTVSTECGLWSSIKSGFSSIGSSFSSYKPSYSSSSWSKPSYSWSSPSSSSWSSGSSSYHSYPSSSSGLSGSSSYSGSGLSSFHSYPSSSGLSGSSSSSGKYSSSSLSGSGSSSYHTYPSSSSGLSGSSWSPSKYSSSSSGSGYSSFHSYPSSSSGLSGSGSSRGSYRPIATHITGPQAVYVHKYKDSRSPYSDLLTGLALYNLGRSSNHYQNDYYYDDYYRQRYGSTGSSYTTKNKPEDEVKCVLKVKQDKREKVLKIPCEIVSTFTEGSTKAAPVPVTVNKTVCKTVISTPSKPIATISLPLDLDEATTNITKTNNTQSALNNETTHETTIGFVNKSNKTTDKAHPTEVNITATKPNGNPTEGRNTTNVVVQSTGINDTLAANISATDLKTNTSALKLNVTASATNSSDMISNTPVNISSINADATANSSIANINATNTAKINNTHPINIPLVDRVMTNSTKLNTTSSAIDTNTINSSSLQANISKVSINETKANNTQPNNSSSNSTVTTKVNTVNLTVCTNYSTEVDPLDAEGPKVDPKNMTCVVEIHTKLALYSKDVECNVLIEYAKSPETRPSNGGKLWISNTVILFGLAFIIVR